MLSRRYLMSFSVHSFTRPFNVDQVTISISNRYNRSVHPDPTYELQKAQNWTKLQREMPRLFNASKFRLHKLYEDDAPSRSLHMEWGLTDYASYLGMCCSSERSSQLLKEGEKLQRNPFAFLSRKIGVAAVLETNDGHIVLIKRSKNVGLYQELYDTPGGHPEPCHILLTEEALETGNERLKAHFKDATKHEFFQSIRNEVYEEINISLQQQHPPKLMGVVYQTDACTPSFGTLAAIRSESIKSNKAGVYISFLY